MGKKMRKVVLVLGAGASCDYGFPIGRALRTSLLEQSRDTLQIAKSKPTGEECAAFQREFRASQRYSIDSFLARRAEFTEIGKTAIAAEILHREHVARSTLMGDRHGANWYQYLVNAVAADPWEELDLSWLGVVTFNYDRSFEEFMIRALCASYGRPRDEVVAKVKQLEVLHVYGSLGTVWPGEHELPFGAVGPADVTWAQTVRAAADRLKVIPEGREDDPTLGAVRMLVKSGDRVAFLGFGFDPDNLRRLGAPQTFVRGGSLVGVYATTLNMTGAEVNYASRLLFSNAVNDQGTRINAIGNQLASFGVDCESFLRETTLLK